MSKNTTCQRIVMERIGVVSLAFLYAFYVGTTVFLIYCEFFVPGGVSFGWQPPTLQERIRMVILGPIIFSLFFLYATAFKAWFLILFGEILRANIGYYLVAGIILAMWIFVQLSGHPPTLFSVSNLVAPFEAYLVGCMAAGITFWHFAARNHRAHKGRVS